jgi:hypothetical protein
MPENDQLQTEKEALKVAQGRVWGMSRLKVQWQELSLSKAYKLLQGDPVVLLTRHVEGPEGRHDPFHEDVVRS